MNQYGCPSNHLDQSQREILRNEPKQSKTREQTAISCLIQPTKSCANRHSNYTTAATQTQRLVTFLNIGALKILTKTCVSAKPDTLQVYSFNGAEPWNSFQL